MKLDAQKVFETLQKIGEKLEGDLHILDCETGDDDRIQFRMYHKDGNCLDAFQITELDDVTDQEITFYHVSQEWEGFTPIKTMGEFYKKVGV